MRTKLYLSLLGLMVFSLSACYRGSPSEKPPIHPNPNMDSQKKYKPQSESDFFVNSATLRMPVEGTVSRGDLRTNSRYYQGKDSDGKFVKDNPLALTMDVMKRGQNRFNIYCSPCHSKVGNGKGIITQYAYPIPPTSLHIDRVRALPDGQIFDVITNGIRNMPSYKHQIPVKDRWAIVGYVRALQKSQHATEDDIPKQVLSDLNP